MDRPKPPPHLEPSLNELAYYEALAKRRLAIARSMHDNPDVGEALLWVVDAQQGLVRLVRAVQRYQGRVVPETFDDRPPLRGKFGAYWPYPVD